MTFTSPLFFLFLPVVVLLFWLVADRLRWLLLLIASYVFYASFDSPSLLLVLTLVSLIGYTGGLWLGSMRASDAKGGASILGLGILSCLAILFFVKYLPHLPMIEHAGILTGLTSIGVSYYTFQAISYLIDVYLELQKPEEHPGYFALYLAFFPRLLQGPIERADALLPQLRNSYKFDYDNVRSGMLLFAWGLFCKVVIAERVAPYVNYVYDDVHSHTGLSLVLATYCYAVQIYCDFAGYTNMARGTARIFNIHLTDNFNHPYVATSVADFWRRWHIWFSRWIFDYIFKPLQLGWRNWGAAGTVLALLVTFLASGIWHGAKWGFIIWGLLHGTYLAASVLYKPYQKKLRAVIHTGKGAWYGAFQVFVTFNLVCFAWIFFRANNVEDALYVVRNVANLSGWTAGDGLRVFVSTRILLGHGSSFVALGLTVIALLGSSRDWLSVIQNRSCLIRWAFYFALLYGCLMFGFWGESERFVYFAF